MKARVKPGVVHRVLDPDRGLGRLAQPGEIVDVTLDELRDFADKLDVIPGPDSLAAVKPFEHVKSDGQEIANADEDAFVEVEITVTEAALALSEEYGIDLADVEGTGSGGRILKSDVERHIESMEE